MQYIEQPFATRTVNLNPYNTQGFIGNIVLDPPIDEWFETERQPEMVVDMPGTFDVFSNLSSAGVLDLNLGTVWNNWNDTWAGTVQETNRRTNTSRSGNQVTTVTTIETEQRVGQRRTGIRTGLVPQTVRTSFGDRVVNVAFARTSASFRANLLFLRRMSKVLLSELLSFFLSSVSSATFLLR